MKRTNTIAIVGGGRLSKEFIIQISNADYVIGVDRGAYWLITNGIVPDIAIGDFDSVTKKELALIKKSVKHIELHPADKDFTDMELAVAYAVKQKPVEVVIYGGSGTRADHTLGTLHLLEHFLNAGIAARLVDEHNDVRLVSGKQVAQKGTFRYISILPFSQSATVSLTGFLYEVSRLSLTRGQTRGISNEFAADVATIEVHEGIVWVIQSSD
ncbi:thiamine diphosphokinase [Candidatus Gottesmanbacteria bacterium]|nr:thiamine diphosphokinase [Candidatus Gottesmanbacteria bacterium]